jgi:uncharacterized membrane protein YoaK (UPF0700 family)
MATTFVTNHVRQTGSYLVRWLRKRDDKVYLEKTLKHFFMIIMFVVGVVVSTIACGYFKEKAIFGANIILLIIFLDLLYADLVTEKELLDKIPRGH